VTSNTAEAAGFGDNVRISDTPLTREAGFANLRGVAYGVTTPSVSGVAFIGAPEQDSALNVHFDSRNEGFWFAADLVEFVDHGAGTEFSLDGVDKKLIRRADGGWDEKPKPSSRPWWKLW
jgi:hypothetical protein